MKLDVDDVPEDLASEFMRRIEQRCKIQAGHTHHIKFAFCGLRLMDDEMENRKMVARCMLAAYRAGLVTFADRPGFFIVEYPPIVPSIQGTRC